MTAVLQLTSVSTVAGAAAYKGAIHLCTFLALALVIIDTLEPQCLIVLFTTCNSGTQRKKSIER